MVTYSLISPHNTTFEVLKRMLIALLPFLDKEIMGDQPTRKVNLEDEISCASTPGGLQLFSILILRIRRAS